MIKCSTQNAFCIYLGVEFRYEVVLFIITWAFEFEVILLQQLLILCLLGLGPFTTCIHRYKSLKA